ncbi:sensor histidine kinase [Pedobacter caeni]|uniref:Histidine kinase n=1 Tax=Pedobacter caeni TaxID=288992 RepID=A0A1M4UPD6_9SPHI|nr:histidine kinase [Pedobacter caeni]SHE58460.1 Histidine kinase [Pedobacter caeni]
MSNHLLGNFWGKVQAGLPEVSREVLHRLQEFAFFVGLIFWVAILYNLEEEDSSWLNYVRGILVFGLAQFPALVFSWYKTVLKERLSNKQYWWSRLICFGVCLPAATLITILIKPWGFFEGAIFISSIACLSLEVLLEVNRYYQLSVKHVRWLKKLDLDGAILISLVLVSVILGAMGVSSLEKPEYLEKGYLLIYFELNFRMILQHFGTFLSFSFQFLFMYLCGYLFFFINSRVLVSRVLKQQGRVMYVLSVLTTVSILYPLIGQLLISLPINKTIGGIIADNPFKMENAFSALGIILISLPIVLALQWARQNTRIVALEKEKTQTELDLLRQQLNPHFFFNTLNNLYALSLQQSKEAPESILQLSELMRYVIYRGKEESVGITEEVKYIQDYIQLQQLRLRKKLDLNFSLDITDENQQIAPLLLIIFVENAFKHGIEPAEEAAKLNMSLTCKGDILYFSCENSFESRPEKVSGIGLQNLSRRLALLYPDRHMLKTGINNTIFKAELELNLR